MIQCSKCQTLNPEAETICLACGTAFDATRRTGVSRPDSPRCEVGHPIDPSWKSCPYCERDAGARAATRLDDSVEPKASGAVRPTRLESGDGNRDVGKTRLSGSDPDAKPPDALPASAGASRPTRLEEGGARTPRQRTVLSNRITGGEGRPLKSSTTPDVDRAIPALSPMGAPRPLLGVLVAPGLGTEGSLFPVRGGKTSIGCSADCDVVIRGDSEVSREHAVLLARDGTFQLADRISTNGTWVNDEAVPANGTRPLEDRDRLRVGGTELVFLVVDPTGTD